MALLTIQKFVLIKISLKVPEEAREEREEAGDTGQSKRLRKSFNPGLQSAQIGSDRAGSKDHRGTLIFMY